MKTHKINGVMPFSALIEACWREPYNAQRFVKDIIAGITVGIIAIPLAMALAIGSGVPPQYGLYTSAVAGIVIALSGGSRFSVTAVWSIRSVTGDVDVWGVFAADGTGSFWPPD